MINTEISHFVLPSAPVKTLWFEFLFCEGLLETHLEQGNCDPTPIELILQFLNHANATSPTSSVPQIPTNGQSTGTDGSQMPSVQEKEGMTIWSEDMTEKEKKAFLLRLLTQKVASFLKWDLDVFEAKLPLTMQLMVVDDLRKMSKDSECQLYADVLYHRWILRSLTKASYPIRNPKGQSLAIPILQQIDPSYIPFEVMQSLITKLHKEIETSLSELERVSSAKGPLDKSKTTLCPTIKCFKVKPVNSKNGDKTFFDWSYSQKIESKILMNTIRFELGKYYFIRDVNYLKADSLFQTIPKNVRKNFEHLNGYIEACKHMLKSDSVDDSKKSDNPWDECLEKIRKGQICDTLSLESKFGSDMMIKMSKDIPEKSVQNFSVYLKTRMAGVKKESPDLKMEIKIEDDDEDFWSVEQRILDATDPDTILNLSSHVSVAYYDLNSSWTVPRLLMNCIQSLPGQHFNRCQVILAKADELRRSKLFSESRTLYLSVMEEMQALIPALSELLPYEILETDLEAYIESDDEDERKRSDLLLKCSNALRCERMVTDLSPVIIEMACAFLLDNFHPCLMDYSQCVNPTIRMTALLYVASKQTGSVKSTKELWDCLVLALSESTLDSGMKRSKVIPKCPSMNLETFCSFLKKLRNPHVMSVITSGLIKMHNLVRDNSSNEISANAAAETVHWPTSLSVSQVMPDLDVISSVLKQALSQSLEMRPDDVSCIKCRAELQLIENQLSDSLKNFLLMMSIVTQHFTCFRGTDEEEYAVSKMIIVTSKMGCHTSSAILQQMLSQPNYSLAFKSLCERSCCDSADDLYEFFWDMNMIEYLVNLHTRRGDSERKLKALQLISRLDLNANNSPEILREAANVRKRLFFGVLAKKYM